jgi:hypothetical protein
MENTTTAPLSRPIPLKVVVLCALAFHGPLLLMRMPANSFDANFHMSMASHYAQHWFDPWNEKAFAGFSQTTYPPLTHQWIAMISHLTGLTLAYMIVQLIVVLLLPVGVYRFAELWTTKRAASYAAFASIFLGALCQLLYQDGQIGTTSATALFLLALPFAYRYVVEGHTRDVVLGLCIACTAAAAHHATLLFGMLFFVPPLVWLALTDWRSQHGGSGWVVPARRTALFAALAGVGVVVVLLPYFLILLKDPITQTPIPHLSRSNYLKELTWGVHYWLVPFGSVVLALPYIFYKGSERRLLPLFIGFYFALIFGLGGTTPLPRVLLGRAFEVLTFERFTFWALILATPFVGMLGAELIDRYHKRAAIWLVVGVVAPACLAVAWNVYFPLLGVQPDVTPIVNFLNQKGRDRYRYLTLGYANAMSKIACYTNAPSVDGEYNSARTLPEMTRHGVGQLSSAKYYGTDGILALSEMLNHAPRYGLRYIFVHDSYYEPLLTFAGWRQIENYNHGETTVWTTNGIAPAKQIPSPFRPPVWQGIMWGIVPFGTSLLTIALGYLSWKESRRSLQDQEASSRDQEDAVPESQPELTSHGSGRTTLTARTAEGASSGIDPSWRSLHSQPSARLLGEMEVQQPRSSEHPKLS